MSDTPELIKGVLVDGQIHKIDYNALANKPSIPEIPNVVSELEELENKGNDYKAVTVIDGRYSAFPVAIPILTKEYAVRYSKITTLSLNDCIIIGEQAFYSNTSLEELNIPYCILIDNNAFTGHSYLSVDASNCKEIGEWAFANAEYITIKASRCEKIGNQAFYSVGRMSPFNIFGVTNIRTIGVEAFKGVSFVYSDARQHYFNACTRIGSSAFENIYANGQEFYFPELTSLGACAFKSCSINELSFDVLESIPYAAFQTARVSWFHSPKCKMIESYAFSGASISSYITFNECSYIGEYAFASVNKLVSITIPKCEIIGSFAFLSNKSLSFVSPLNYCRAISEGAFSYCSNLLGLSVRELRDIGSNAFNKCYKFKSLYIYAESVCTLENINAFTSTPIGGYSTIAGQYGSVYVPASLYSQYIVASYWSDIASRIVSM